MNLRKISAACVIAVAALFTTGCASNGAQEAYYNYLAAKAKADEAVGVAQAKAAQARYQSAAIMAANAGETAKAAIGVAQAMAEVKGDGSGYAKAATSPVVRPPETSEQVAFRWASMLTGAFVPAWVADRSSSRAADVAITQSNNSAAVQMNSNSTMLGLGLGSAAFGAAAPVELYTDNMQLIRTEAGRLPATASPAVQPLPDNNLEALRVNQPPVE
jgi:ABC-type sulfate transport system substrate-binding protein